MIIADGNLDLALLQSPLKSTWGKILKRDSLTIPMHMQVLGNWISLCVVAVQNLF